MNSSKGNSSIAGGFSTLGLAAGFALGASEIGAVSDMIFEMLLKNY